MSDQHVPPGADRPDIARFATDGFGLREQFDAVRTHMSPVADLALPDDKPEHEGFVARQLAYQLGNLLMTVEYKEAFIAHNTPDRLNRTGIDHWVFILHRNGTLFVQSDDNVSVRKPGDVSITSFASPFVAEQQETMDALFLYVPRSMFADNTAAIDAMHNVPLQSGLLGILRDHILSLERHLPDVGADELTKIIPSTAALVEACLLPNDERLHLAEDVIGSTLFRRAQSIIRDSIHSRDLTPDFIAKSLMISRSSLYRLFEPVGGVANQIRQERLSIAHDVLSNPLERRRLYEIAEDFGFGSATEFSRAFRRQFGHTPQDARGRGVPRTVSVPPLAETSSFRNWIINLGQRRS